MRYTICGATVLVCLAAAGGVAYLHGYERALGREEWRFESRLVSAYAGEVPVHAGPLGVLIVAAFVALRSPRSQRLVLVAALAAAGLALYETRESERAYIVTLPGQLMSSPGYCTAILIVLWLASFGVLSAAASGAFRGARVDSPGRSG